MGVGWSGKDIPVGGEYDGGGGQVWVREAIPGRGDSVNKDPEASSSKEWLRVAETASSGQGVAGDTTRGVSRGRNQRPSWTTVGSAITLESPCGVQAG